MSRDKQRLSDYLSHIREAIERIDRYTGDINEEVFLKNEMAQDAVIRNFEIIGEASHNIERDYPDFAAAHPELPLLPAYEMRNAVAHGSSVWIWNSSGIQSILTCRDYTSGCESWLMICSVMTARQA